MGRLFCSVLFCGAKWRTGNHRSFTFSQVPRDVSDQIYGRVQGAYYDTTEEFWMIPCGQMLNITFNFGGQSYPVHPLDTVDDNFNRVDSTGQPICIGAVSIPSLNLHPRPDILSFNPSPRLSLYSATTT
jgi:hypothetical protein